MKTKKMQIALLSGLSLILTSCGGNLAKDVYYEAIDVRKTVSNSEGESNAERFDEYRNKFIDKEITVSIYVPLVSDTRIKFNGDRGFQGSLIIQDGDKNIIAGSENGSVSGFIGDNPIKFYFPYNQLEQNDLLNKLKEYTFFLNNLENQITDNFLEDQVTGSTEAYFFSKFDKPNVTYDFDLKYEEKFQHLLVTSDQSINKIIEKLSKPDNIETNFSVRNNIIENLKEMVDELKKYQEDGGPENVYIIPHKYRTKENNLSKLNKEAKQNYFNCNWNIINGLIIKVKGKISKVTVSQEAQDSKLFKQFNIAESPYYFTLEKPILESVEFTHPVMENILKESTIKIKTILDLIEKNMPKEVQKQFVEINDLGEIVNLTSLPNGGGILTMLKSGDKVELINSSGEYREIKLENGITGFIHEKYILNEEHGD